MVARWMFRIFLRRRGLALLGTALVAAERAYRERQARQAWTGTAVPPPTYSSDGRWWWDGANWHSVTVASPPPDSNPVPPSRIVGG